MVVDLRTDLKERNSTSNWLVLLTYCICNSVLLVCPSEESQVDHHNQEQKSPRLEWGSFKIIRGQSLTKYHSQRDPHPCEVNVVYVNVHRSGLRGANKKMGCLPRNLLLLISSDSELSGLRRLQYLSIRQSTKAAIMTEHIWKYQYRKRHLTCLKASAHLLGSSGCHLEEFPHKSVQAAINHL